MLSSVSVGGWRESAFEGAVFLGCEGPALTKSVSSFCCFLVGFMWSCGRASREALRALMPGRVGVLKAGSDWRGELSRSGLDGRKRRSTISLV